MFNGATDRYDWKLIGKKDIYIPYNAYKSNGPDLKIRDVIRPGHINPEHARYELHRVWHVRASLMSGTSHIYKARDFFLAEASFIVHVADQYDNHDELWRVDDCPPYTDFDAPVFAPGGDRWRCRQGKEV